MYTLTVKNPWAWAIIHAGKDVENRTWAPTPNAIGQLVAIHASQKADIPAAWARCRSLAQRNGVVLDDGNIEATNGHILGVVRLLRVGEARSPWAEIMCRHWVLGEPVAFREPIPCRGALALWQLPPAVEVAVMEAMGDAQMERELKRPQMTYTPPPGFP